MNKQTTQSKRPRSLWLERLERRWMLHGHADFFAMDHDDHRRDSGSQRTRDFEVGDPLRLQTNDQLRGNHQPDRHGHGRVGDHRVPRISEQVAIEARPLNPASVETILAPLPLTVIVILQPVTNVSSPPISLPIVQDNAFQLSAPAVSAPIVTAPLVGNAASGDVSAGPEAQLPNIDNALQTFSANDSDTESSATSKLTAEAEDAAKSIQVETLVSIQPRESQVSQVEEPSDFGDVRFQIENAIDSRLTLETERIDSWLGEYSKVQNQLSDLESTLNDLAEQQRDYRGLVVGEIYRSHEQDQAKSNWRANGVLETGAIADEMIRLTPIADTAEMRRMVADELWIESDTAQWNLGVGWYRSFEFSDPADAEAAIDQSPPIVMAAATTSDLVLDAARLTNKDQPHMPISRSVTYTIVAVSVASWQVLQRRKRSRVAR